MRLLAYILLWGFAAALPTAAVAQTAAERDKALAVAPQAAPAQAPTTNPTERRGTAAGPANICRELVAYLEKKAATAPLPATAQPGPNSATSAAGASVQASGQPAPVPQASTAGAPAADDLAKAMAMAEADDLQGCQQTVRKMRRAGLDLPPPLLALAALKPELLGAAKP